MTLDRKQELLLEIAKLAAELDWNVAIPQSNDDSVPGLIIGNDEFLQEIANASNEPLDVFVNPKDKKDNGNLH